MARVLYLITSTGVGGTELALLQLVGRLDRSRFEPLVVSVKEPGEVAERIRALDVEVASLRVSDETGPFGALETLLAARRLPALLAGRRVDLVHSFLFRANLVARLAARRLGSPPLVNAIRVTPDEERPWMRRADRWTAGRVTLFHVQSERLADGLGRRLGVAPERFVVIPNGVDLAAADAALAAARPGARAALGLSRADVAIACVGRLHPQKGLPDLLAAFHALLRTLPTARLLVAGDGPARRDLEAIVDALRLRPFARFLGPVSSPWPLLAAADVFALPSRWEGMPNALLEAMAAGLPCVATAVGAVPEVADGGKAALVVPAADPKALGSALGELCASAALRRELGGRGRRRVETAYRAEDCVAAIERLYGELLAARGAAG